MTTPTPVLTPKSAIGDIIAKLEAASGPDPGLDVLICRVASPTEWEKYRNWAAMPSGAPAEVMDRDAVRWVPTYTSSLDASLALAAEKLPRWSFQLCQNRHYDSRAGIGRDWSAWFDAPNDLGRDIAEVDLEAFGPTAPIASLKALFKALEAQ